MPSTEQHYFYSNLGPPDPIEYLRRAESSSHGVVNNNIDRSRNSFRDDLSRHDSDDDYDILLMDNDLENTNAEEEENVEDNPHQHPRQHHLNNHYHRSEQQLQQEQKLQHEMAQLWIDGESTSQTQTQKQQKCQHATQPQEQDPPARERPADNRPWPYRETLSFTRDLIFYGAGSMTTEAEQACIYVLRARRLRRKYFGGRGVVVMGDDGSTPSTSASSASVLTDPRIECRMGKDGVMELFIPPAEAVGIDSADSPNTDTETTSTLPTTTAAAKSLVTVPSIEAFSRDYHRLVEMVSEGSMRSFCFQRLQILGSSFKMHNTMNASVEREEQSNLLGTDFYRTMKIDNHIHAAAAPTAKTFVEFVRRKLETEPDTQVMCKDGQTLSRVFAEAGLNVDHLTIDAFNVLADYSVYQRFDQFNQKYSPFALADMRRIFLKTNNHIEGRYFAELLKVVIQRHELSKGHTSACELRLSIYGMERHEWYDLSKWILRDWQCSSEDQNHHGGNSSSSTGPMISTHNRWLVQIPRLWRIYCKKPVQVDDDNNDKRSPNKSKSKQQQQSHPQCKRSFVEMIQNIFVPLFEATLHPDQHPEIAEAMTHIVGFDSVDDEGVMDVEPSSSCSSSSSRRRGDNNGNDDNDNDYIQNHILRPAEWTSEKNPSFWWQLYFLWANMEVLNHVRSARGLNTFAFRPHAGETGDPMHLAATYLLCQSINHGILLDMQVSLQYLYYLDQIGLSISPLSNNFLFRKIAENPFPKFFRRGLNVTISTDDPLLFHMSDDALLEEYSVARATFDLSMTDMMELARNSILQSGFEDKFKRQWLGKAYKKGVTFCDERITHVPLIRAKFRAEHLAVEHMMVHLIAAGKGDKVLQQMKVQFGLARDAHRSILFENFDQVPSFPELGQL